MFKVVDDPEKGECLTLSDGWWNFLQVQFLLEDVLDMHRRVQVQYSTLSPCVPPPPPLRDYHLRRGTWYDFEAGDPSSRMGGGGGLRVSSFHASSFF